MWSNLNIFHISHKLVDEKGNKNSMTVLHILKKKRSNNIVLVKLYKYIDE